MTSAQWNVHELSLSADLPMLYILMLSGLFLYVIIRKAKISHGKKQLQQGFY